MPIKSTFPKNTIWIFIVVLACTNVYGQVYDNIIEDLHEKIDAHPTEDQTLVDLLNDMSYAYRRSSPTKIDSFARTALQLAKKIDYKKGMAIAYKNQGIAEFKLGVDIDTLISLYQKCHEMAKQVDDFYTQAACLNNIGLSYTSNLQYLDAVKAFQNALEIHEKYLAMDRLRLLIIGNIGKSYIKMDDLQNASLYLERVLDLAEQYDNEPITVMYMEDYAFVQYKQGKVKQAIETIKENLPKAKSLGDYQTFIQASIKLADILIQEHKFDQANIHIDQGLKIARAYNFTNLECEIMLNKAMVLSKKDQLEEALELSQYSYDCSKDRDITQQIKAAKILLSIHLDHW